MKKPKLYNIVLTILALTPFSSYSQKFYIPFQIGYNVPVAPQNLTSKSYYTPFQSSQEIVSGSFGQGFTLFTGLGYRYDSTFTFEAGFSVNQSPAFNGTVLNDTLYRYDYQISAWVIRFLPSVKIHFCKNKWHPYFKFTPVIRLAGGISVVNNYQDFVNNNSSRSEIIYSHGFSIGIGAGIGIQKRINSSVSFVCDLNFISQSWAPKNGDVVSYTVNGQDQFSSLSTNQKHIHFSSKANNGTFSTYKPAIQPKQYSPFSSIGLNAGLIFNLKKKNRNKP